VIKRKWWRDSAYRVAPKSKLL